MEGKNNIVIIGALIIVAAAVLVIVIMNRKSKTTTAPTIINYAPTPTNQAPTNSQNNAQTWANVAAGLGSFFGAINNQQAANSYNYSGFGDSSAFGASPYQSTYGSTAGIPGY